MKKLLLILTVLLSVQVLASFDANYFYDRSFDEGEEGHFRRVFLNTDERVNTITVTTGASSSLEVGYIPYYYRLSKDEINTGKFLWMVIDIFEIESEKEMENIQNYDFSEMDMLVDTLLLSIDESATRKTIKDSYEKYKKVWAERCENSSEDEPITLNEKLDSDKETKGDNNKNQDKGIDFTIDDMKKNSIKDAGEISFTGSQDLFKLIIIE